MTITEQRPSTATTVALHASSRRPRPTRTVAIVALVLIVGAALTAWWFIAASARAGVVILADQHSLSCSPSTAATTTVADVENDDQDPLVIPAIRLNGPTTCTMTYVIDNTGGLPVTINAVKLKPMLPLTGIHTGAIGQVGSIGVPVELGAGQATRITIGVTWTHGCVAHNGTDTDSDTLTATVTAAGIPGTVARPGPAYAVLGTTTSETHCPWKQ